MIIDKMLEYVDEHDMQSIRFDETLKKIFLRDMMTFEELFYSIKSIQAGFQTVCSYSVDYLRDSNISFICFFIAVFNILGVLDQWNTH